MHRISERTYYRLPNFLSVHVVPCITAEAVNPEVRNNITLERPTSLSVFVLAACHDLTTQPLSCTGTKVFCSACARSHSEDGLQ